MLSKLFGNGFVPVVEFYYIILAFVIKNLFQNVQLLMY